MHEPVVRELMSSPVIAVTRQTRLPVIKSLLEQKKIRRLAVMDGEELLGIITLGDVRHAFPSDVTLLNVLELSYLIDKVTAEEIMRSQVITVDADTRMVEAARLMLEHKVSGLPVFEHGRLVGMITETDILQTVIDGSIASLNVDGTDPRASANRVGVRL